jgi:hypothetical protein
MIDRQKWIEIQKELEELRKLHEETLSNSAKCREFNSRASFLLQKVEDMGFDRVADFFMDLLVGCSPKDFSHCENHDRTKATLERIRVRINDSLSQK